jgi:hypothetical protein
MARAIFFSARSFLGRSEMLAAAIESASFNGPKGPISRQIIEEGLQKENGYASFRNALAHGYVIRQFSQNGHNNILVQGKHPTYLHAETGITVDRFKVAGENFASLADVLSTSLINSRSKTRPVSRLRLLQAHYERLLLLPNEPDRAKPSQKQLGRLRQRKAAAREKSHT